MGGIYDPPATLRAVTYGNCLTDGQRETDDAASIPLYDLDMLAPGVVNLLRVWSRFCLCSLIDRPTDIIFTE